ncbi:AIPR family protein [Enterococcus sp. CWB-B31]|uniref:AIPR family protein n=1 Tax=Enterococcus sp. CWB-B31 TaxID=2885159 RepID=UPI001E4D6887|nr:AIPR family protein [Enterococcus sp. CWB-B31]MCB5953952.1 AIPR family protein [Enterococcus sp. CWB-B31]
MNFEVVKNAILDCITDELGEMSSDKHSEKKILDKIVELNKSNEYAFLKDEEIGLNLPNMKGEKHSVIVAILHDGYILNENNFSLFIKDVYIYWEKNVKSDDETSKVDLLVATSNISNKIKLINDFSKIKETLADSKQISSSNLFLAMFSKLEDDMEFLINIGNRVDSLEEQANRASYYSVNGLIYSVPLFDMVEIYSKMGNKLFSKNLRYGIDDELGVNKEIINTLIQNPENFWFLNNGITLVVTDNSIERNLSNYIKLKVTKNEQFKNISVINGAQTISASSQFFFGNYTEENIEKAKKNAKVLLRVIYLDYSSENRVINDIKEDEEKSEFEKISIALNRQKPIKQEDIVYTSPLITRINQLGDQFDRNQGNSIYFKITRRGEDVSERRREYSLKTFAKVVNAYLAQDPAKSRTSSTKTLLEMKKDSSMFKDEDIFPLLNEENSDRIFKEKYSPFNYCVQLSTRIEDTLPQLETKDESEKIFISNGKWYLVSFIIYHLREGEISDFSDWDLDEKKLQILTKDLLKELVKTVVDNLNKKNVGISVNSMKTKKMYDAMIEVYDQKDYEFLNVLLG